MMAADRTGLTQNERVRSGLLRMRGCKAQTVMFTNFVRGAGPRAVAASGAYDYSSFPVNCRTDRLELEIRRVYPAGPVCQARLE